MTGLMDILKKTLAQSYPAYNAEKAVSVAIYSFPRSGNRWMRAILAAGFGMENVKRDVSRYVIDTAFKQPLQNPWECQGKDWFFYKSHLINPLTDKSGTPVPTDKIIYIYRNPLDVFVSYLNFLSSNVGNVAGERAGFNIETVESLSPGRMEWFLSRWIADATLFPENKRYGSWFDHVNAYRKRAAEGEPIHVLKYEDLHEDFEGTVSKLFGFLGVEPLDLQTVYSLADQGTAQDNKAAWKRVPNNYPNYLTDEQVKRFALVWEKELAELGYTY